jgi:DNA-directed RNA polymerase subunit RPC12/RpoP
MVKLISTTPHHSVVKESICKNCGSTLEYTPSDINSYTARSYDGSSDTYNYIICPNCNHEVHVK